MHRNDTEDMEQTLIRLQQQLEASQRQCDKLQQDNDLYQQLNTASTLDQLLTDIGSRIQAHPSVDGYIINLINPEQSHLICEKISLPAKFKGIETTYYKYSYPLDNGNLNADTFYQQASRRIHTCDIDDLELRDRFTRWDITSIAAIPVLTSPKALGAAESPALGTVIIFSQSEDVPPELVSQTEQHLQLAYKQLANALHTTELERLQQGFKTAQKDQRRFLEFVERVNSLTAADQVYDTFTKELLRHYNFDLSAVILKQDDRLVVKKSTIIDERFSEMLENLNRYYQSNSFKIDPLDGATAMAFCQNNHLIIKDAMEVLHLPMSDMDKNALVFMETPRTFLFIPIYKDDEIIGILWLFSLADIVEVSDNDLTIIKLLCRFFGAAISNAETYEIVETQKDKISDLNANLEHKVIELNNLAIKDRLTELYNFGYFQEELQRRIKEYQRLGDDQQIALVICDLDHFKFINDTFGHVGGNAALQDVSKRISQQAREMDVICRYGGEEFVAILPMCDLVGARIFAERVRRVIEATPVSVASSSTPMTISLGCASYQKNETMTQFIQRADQALYRAKEQGRNRVEMAEEQKLVAQENRA